MNAVRGRSSLGQLAGLGTELVRTARRDVSHGRFQRTMALVTAFSSIVSGLEAYSQHSRGDFSDRWMWTPVWLTPPGVAAAAASLASERAARSVLPLTSLASLADGAIGFALHLRGIRRMPGGYGIGQYNVVIGPPVFAPLLVTSVGVLGLFASALRPESDADPSDTERAPAFLRGVTGEIAHGRFQQGMAITAAAFAALSGGEAYFEHLRGSYNQRLMWTPIWITPPMIAAAIAAARDPAAAESVLPVASLATFADGLLGFGLHLRGISRMPGGLTNLRFNATLGPPLFAPLLFTAVGMLGLTASLLRRQGRQERGR